MGWVRITDDLIAELNAEKERTGLGPAALLSGRKDIPRGLNANLIGHWLRGDTKQARAEHLTYVRARWSALPHDPTIVFTAAMRREIKAQLERTGLGGRRLLKGRHDIPPGLTAEMIGKWGAGKRKNVRQDHWEYVTRLFAEIDAGLVELSPALRAELEAERRRTGIGPMGLLKRASDIPPGLSARMISTWLRGKTRRAKAEHLDYARNRWRALPDKKK